MTDRKRILTGLRPTGPLQVGHYAGAIESWLRLRHEHDCYFLIADWQVSDHAGDPCARVRDAVWDVALDWLAAGLDPERSSFVIESLVPEHAGLAMWLARESG
jgi:tryptophanyl-tRNA synthetase